MALSLRIPVLIAGAIATAIALAPAATADPGPDDTADTSVSATDSRSTSAAGARSGSNRNPTSNNQLTTDYTSDDLPEGWTNEAQWARPGASNPFGLGPKPPVLALD